MTPAIRPLALAAALSALPASAAAPAADLFRPLARGGDGAAPAVDSPNLGLRPAPLPKATSRGDVRGLYRKAAPATVIVRSQHGHGSGVVISKDGLVLTNHHVAVDGAREGLRVRVDVEVGRLGPDGAMQRTGATYPAHVVKWDRRMDIALLRIDTPPADLVALPVAKVNVSPGEPIAVLGHGGIGLLWSIRDCQVAATGHLYDSLAKDVVAQPVGSDDAAVRRARRERPASLIQSTCVIARGDSGGPVVNTDAEVVGLNDFIMSDAPTPVATNYHVDGRELRAFLADAPKEAQAILPDPWDAGDEAQLGDLDHDGVADALYLKGRGRAALLVDVAQRNVPAGARADPEQLLERRAFPAPAVFVLEEGKAYAFYDTTGAGRFDLFLEGDAETGATAAGWRIGAGGATALAAPERPARLVVPALLRVPEQAQRLSAVMATAIPSWSGPGMRMPWPDLFPQGEAKVSAASTDAAGRTAALGWSQGEDTAILVDPAGGLPAATRAADLAALRGKVRLALVKKSGKLWALYDRNGDGTIDLATESDAGDQFVTRTAFTGAPAPAPEHHGRLLVRPGLFAAADGARISAVLGELGLGPALAAREDGLGTLPAVQGSTWSTGGALDNLGQPGTIFGLEREGAQAIVADLTGKRAGVPADASLQAIGAGKFPATFAWLHVHGMEWTFYDRNGDGVLDLVLFAPDAKTGKCAQAWAVGKGGALEALPSLAGKGLFQARLLGDPAAVKRALALFDAAKVRAEARD